MPVKGKGKPEVYSRPNSSQLWLKYYDENGQLVRRSAGTEDPHEARAKLDDILKQIKETKQHQAANNSIEEGFNLFMETNPLKKGTFRAYDYALDAWMEFIRLNHLRFFDELNKRRIREFITWRKRRGIWKTRKLMGEKKLVRVGEITDATIRADLAFLSSVWNYLLDEPDWEERMPLCPITRRLKRKHLKRLRKRIRFASADEWERLLAACTTDQQRDILTFAVETGLRHHSELCTLTWQQIDLKRRQISLIPDLVDVKNDEPRIIPLSEAAILVLSHTTRHNRFDWVFWHEPVKGADHDDPESWRFKSMNNWWAETRRRAGVKNFRFHDIRHTFASNFLNDGGSISALKIMLGHSSIGVTERYAHLIMEALHEEVQTRDKKRSLTQPNSSQ